MNFADIIAHTAFDQIDGATAWASTEATEDAAYIALRDADGNAHTVAVKATEEWYAFAVYRGPIEDVELGTAVQLKADSGAFRTDEPAEDAAANIVLTVFAITGVK